MNNLFLDTNVVIDFLANRLPHVESSARLFDLAEKGKVKLFISALSYSTIYYIIRKAVSHKKLIEILDGIQSLTETLDVSRSIISKSLKSDFKDFEDAIQYYTALSNKEISAIVTRDPKGYRNSDITIVTPDEAVAMLIKSR